MGPPSASWFGPARGHVFFAEGYTGSGYQEYLSLLNPNAVVMHAQLTFYRSDGAVRYYNVEIGPYRRRTLNVNTLAPRSSTALRVAADGFPVVERSLYDGSGHVVAGVPLPSRQWYISEGYVGPRFADGLRVFNPYDLPSAVTITAYSSDGSRHVSHVVVAADTRTTVSLDDIAPVGQLALNISASLPVVVESLVRSFDAAGPSAAMALTAPSKWWCFPDGGTTKGNYEYISVFNPHDQTTAVHLYGVASRGYDNPITIRVQPYSRAVYAVQGLIHQSGLAAVVQSDKTIVAQEVRYTSSGGVSLTDGAARPARDWALADGYNGAGFKEWIVLVNPNTMAARVVVHPIGRNGMTTKRVFTVPAKGRLYVGAGALLPSGPVAALVDANSPIVVGRTMIFNKNVGLSTTIGVALPPSR